MASLLLLPFMRLAQSFRADYSMIVATLPEPTVLPPSRFSVVEIRVILCNFQGFFGTLFFDMRLVSEVLQIFVIIVLSRKH